MKNSYLIFAVIVLAIQPVCSRLPVSRLKQKKGVFRERKQEKNKSEDNKRVLRKQQQNKDNKDKDKENNITEYKVYYPKYVPQFYNVKVPVKYGTPLNVPNYVPMPQYNNANSYMNGNYMDNRIGGQFGGMNNMNMNGLGYNRKKRLNKKG